MTQYMHLSAGLSRSPADTVPRTVPTKLLKASALTTMNAVQGIRAPIIPATLAL